MLGLRLNSRPAPRKTTASNHLPLSPRRLFLAIYSLEREEFKGSQKAFFFFLFFQFGAPMAAAASQMTLQRVFDGCIAFLDTEIRRRPYHRNCSCALHQSGGLLKGLPCSSTKVSYPVRRSWGVSIASSPMSAGDPADAGGFQAANFKEGKSLD